MRIRIIYEDDAILVIAKPAAVLVHGLTGAGGLDLGTGDGEDGIGKSVVDWLVEHYPGMGEHEWPDKSRPGIVHRLDRDTSGVLVIAKTPVALANLQEQFASRRVEKQYLALVVGQPEWQEHTIRAPVARASGTKRRAQYFVAPGDQAKLAETRFAVLNRYSGVELATAEAGSRSGGKIRNNELRAITSVTAQPRTGRTHQIRVHLGLLGFPILGDPWYRTKVSKKLAEELEVPRLMLHAEKLTITHPKTGERMTFAAPVPTDFAQILERLRYQVI